VRVGGIWLAILAGAAIEALLFWKLGDTPKAQREKAPTIPNERLAGCRSCVK
jgi:hypothetical protein